MQPKLQYLFGILVIVVFNLCVLAMVGRAYQVRRQNGNVAVFSQTVAHVPGA